MTISKKQQQQQRAKIYKDFDALAAETVEKVPQLEATMPKLRKLLEAAEGLSIKDSLEGFSRLLSAMVMLGTLPPYNPKEIEILVQLGEDAEQLTGLMPEMEAELKRFKFRRKITDEITFDEFTNSYERDGETPRESLFDGIRKRAEMLLKTSSPLATEVTKLPKTIAVPTSNLNNKIWQNEYNPEDAEEANIFKLDPLTAYKDQKARTGPIKTLCLIDFNQLGANVSLPKNLTEFDELVYNAVASLYRENKTIYSDYVIVSVTQIHRAMGGTSKPNEGQKNRIFDSLSKMSFTRLTIDNKEEAKYSSYSLYPYEGPLLAADFLPYPRIINGKQVEQPIRIMATPTLYAYAEARKQVSYVPLSTYQVRLSKTPQGLAIFRHLLQVALWAKNEKREQATVLISTLLKKAHIKNRAAKQRAISDAGIWNNSKISVVLEHLKKQGHISDYEVTAQNIEMYFAKEIQKGQ